MFKIAQIARTITVCRKCSNEVLVINWGYGNVEYVCDKCGYTTKDTSKVSKKTSTDVGGGK